MKTIGIGIKTADRSPRHNYLADTFGNLARAGVFRSPHLYGLRVYDSCVEDWAMKIPPGVLLDKPVEQRRSLHENAAEAIRYTAAMGADWTLVLEDDLDFCDRFLESTLAWVGQVVAERREYLMYVLGANYSQIVDARRKKKIVWDYPIGSFYGAQALLWRTNVARGLAEWLGPSPSYNGIAGHGHDLLLGRWAKERGETHFAASVPSFVQHIGKESGIGNRSFGFSSWPGRNWSYA